MWRWNCSQPWSAENISTSTFIRKPVAATAVWRQFDGLLMMGIVMPETCWAVSVRQSNKLYDWLLHLAGCFIRVGFWSLPYLRRNSYIVRLWDDLQAVLNCLKRKYPNTFIFRTSFDVKLFWSIYILIFLFLWKEIRELPFFSFSRLVFYCSSETKCYSLKTYLSFLF